MYNFSYCFVKDSYIHFVVVVVQSLSHFWLFATPWTAAHQAFLSLTISWSLPKFMSIELMMPSNHLIISIYLSCILQIFFPVPFYLRGYIPCQSVNFRFHHIKLFYDWCLESTNFSCKGADDKYFRLCQPNGLSQLSLCRAETALEDSHWMGMSSFILNSAMGGQWASLPMQENLPANAGDSGLIPGSGRFPWRRPCQPIPVFLPVNSTNRGAWWATVRGAAEQSDMTQQP